MLLISYDLNRPGQDYQDLIAAIKAYGNWAHVLKSTWLIRTTQTADQVSTDLRKHMDPNDNLLVIEVNPKNKQGWLSRKFWNWMNGKTA